MTSLLSLIEFVLSYEIYKHNRIDCLYILNQHQLLNRLSLLAVCMSAYISETIKHPAPNLSNKTRLHCMQLN